MVQGFLLVFFLFSSPFRGFHCWPKKNKIQNTKKKRKSQEKTFWQVIALVSVRRGQPVYKYLLHIRSENGSNRHGLRLISDQQRRPQRAQHSTAHNNCISTLETILKSKKKTGVVGGVVCTGTTWINSGSLLRVISPVGLKIFFPFDVGPQTRWEVSVSVCYFHCFRVENQSIRGVSSSSSTVCCPFILNG